MKYRDIKLNIDYKKLGIKHDGFVAHLTAYAPDLRGDAATKGVLICPGGGYAFTSDREGECIALEFVRRGYSAYVLWYSVAPNEFPTQLLEAAEAVDIIRASEEFPCSELYICGFSAGGHLAGSYATLSSSGEIFKYLPSLKGKNISVDGAILGYPVVTGINFSGHQSSFNNLLGDRYDELKDALSVDKLVTKSTPRMFIWHTYADNCVDVRSSLLLACALKECGVPFDLHIYQEGGHGLSLANKLVCETETRHSEWINIALSWLEVK